jgi:hypothetical protein
MFSVDLFDRDKRQIITMAEMSVIRHSSYAVGGPHEATLEVSGSPELLLSLRNWLGYFVIIRNVHNTPVWWGKITDVTTNYGNIEVSASFRDMANRVQVLHTISDGDGYPVPVVTNWHEDARSTGVFGKKELRHSIGEASIEQAEAAAAKILSQSALAQQSFNLATNNAAIIRCGGLWNTLEWLYYSNLGNREIYDGDDNAEQSIGWGITSTDIGFADKKIHRIAGGLDGLQDGERIRISGSLSNNGIKFATGTTGEPETYTSNTISFEADDDIRDSKSGLGFIQSGSFVRVSGSPANSRYHLIDGTGRGAVATSTTVTGNMVTESAGATITIEQGSSLNLSADVVLEKPGATVTIVATTALAYSFVASNVQSYSPSELWLKIRREGSPSDSVVIKLRADSNGYPGTVLDQVTVSGSNLPKAMGWVKLSLNRTANLTLGSVYWITIQRTGSNSTTNYYAVGLDEDRGHNGTLWIGDDATWNQRPKNASMLFQLWGHKETSELIRDIIGTSGQFLAGVDNRVSSGIWRRAYRGGESTALSEIETLLEAGTTTQMSIVPFVTQDWRCIIDAVDADRIAEYKLMPNGSVRTIRDSDIDPGFLPVGKWCEIDGLADGDGLVPLSPFVIGYAEYNTRQGKITDIKPLGKNSIWDLNSILQG